MNILQKLSILNIRNQLNYNFNSNKRLLFSPSSLGIDTFLQERQRALKERNMNLDVYKQKLKETCNTENNIMVFSNDLTKMIYNAENKEDLDLVHKILKKIKSQKYLKIESYYSGAEVMKLHYVMNKPMEAKHLVENPLLYSEFQSPASYIVFLDLLFKNNLFEEVIEKYNYRLNHSKFSFFAPLHIIYFAACYKVNTKESFENAFKVWQTFLKFQYKAGLKIRLLFAALSLNQKQFFCAMEVLPISNNNAIAENLKCIILAKTNRYDDAFENLKKILIDQKNLFVLQETITAIEKEICRSEEHKKQFECIKEDLSNMKKIKNESLDACLCDCVEMNFISRTGHSLPPKSKKLQQIELQ